LRSRCRAVLGEGGRAGERQQRGENEGRNGSGGHDVILDVRAPAGFRGFARLAVGRAAPDARHNGGMTEKTLLLVDGSSYLYRAYHAMPDLRGPGGAPTGALYGIINMLRRMRKEVTAEYSACVFDAKGKPFRDDWYPQYKANRPSMPDDLSRQIEPIHVAVRAL